MKSVLHLSTDVATDRKLELISLVTNSTIISLAVIHTVCYFLIKSFLKQHKKSQKLLLSDNAAELLTLETVEKASETTFRNESNMLIEKKERKESY